jgi:hypothetical protein
MTIAPLLPAEATLLIEAKRFELPLTASAYSLR